VRLLSHWVLAAVATGVLRATALPTESRNVTRACTLRTLPSWSRADTIRYVLLRARADTLPATTWRAPTGRIGRPPQAPDPPPAPERVVYGQHVEIVRVVGPAADSLAALGRKDSAALIAWRMNSMCGSLPPDPTLVLLPGEEAFLATEPRRDARATFRIVILDKSAVSRFYAPSIERARHPREWRRLWRRPSVLSVAEFANLYEALPPASLWEADPTRAVAHLNQWASTHRRLAGREPARSLLENARIAEAELRSRR